jgi:hypothetical protein
MLMHLHIIIIAIINTKGIFDLIFKIVGLRKKLLHRITERKSMIISNSKSFNVFVKYFLTKKNVSND